MLAVSGGAPLPVPRYTDTGDLSSSEASRTPSLTGGSFRWLQGTLGPAPHDPALCQAATPGKDPTKPRSDPDVGVGVGATLQGVSLTRASDCARGKMTKFHPLWPLPHSTGRSRGRPVPLESRAGDPQPG